MSTQSVQSYVVRWMIKHLVGPKFRRAGKSIPLYRELDELIMKNQKVPKNTEITPVRAGDVAAEWISAPDAKTDSAVLYLHGGAFIMGSPATHREIAARLSATAHAKMLVIDYRLAPEHPFPLALKDSLTAYRWLLDNGYSGKRVCIGGDSAGGGLTLQTLITLRDEGDALPAGAFFLSPQTDWVHFDGESYVTRSAVDPLNTEEMCKFSASLYVSGDDPCSPLLSPVNADLTGLPPLCIHVGDHEILLSDSIRLAERARASGVDIDLKVWPGMWHFFQASARFVPEARRSIDDIGRFVRSHHECEHPAVGQ